MVSIQQNNLYPDDNLLVCCCSHASIFVINWFTNSLTVNFGELEINVIPVIFICLYQILIQIFVLVEKC